MKKVSNHEELVAKIQAKMEAGGEKISKDTVRKVIQNLTAVSAEILKEQGAVKVTGLFSASLAYRAGRKGWNVITKEPMDVQEYVAVNITSGQQLKNVAKISDVEAYKPSELK